MATQATKASILLLSCGLLYIDTMFHKPAHQPFLGSRLCPSIAAFRPSASRHTARVMAIAAPPAPSVLTWEELSTHGVKELPGYTMLGKNEPSTAPTPTLKTAESSTTSKPVLLYRDTNGWCPFCQRVSFSRKPLHRQCLPRGAFTSQPWYISRH